MAGRRRQVAMRLGVTYAVRLVASNIAGVAAVGAVVESLSGNTVGNISSLVTEQNLLAISAFLALATVMGAVGGVLILVPTFRWFLDNREPTSSQRRMAVRLPMLQTIIQFGVWVIGGALFVVLNLGGGGMEWVIAAAAFFSGITTACIGYLITQRTLRPIIAAAMARAGKITALPGVLVRLVIIWLLCTVAPIGGIVMVVLASSQGWFVRRSAPIEMPILVLASISLAFGGAAIVLVARSIADPVSEVVSAMKKVEGGRSDVHIQVYDPSEIGRLQAGLNQMVDGLAERARMRDLFGRYVGVDVAQRALQHDTSLSGDVRQVAVLFADLVGSTTMASMQPPDEVAGVLNDFFELVVSGVEDRGGLVNKFGGDSVLAIFGAPLPIDAPAVAALATARTLAIQLRSLSIDFGIGVSYGSVFAGTVGAVNRFEYTVIGDAVNEAARLAERAKRSPSRVVASGRAVASSGLGEQQRWSESGTVVLRGRTEPTELAEPRE